MDIWDAMIIIVIDNNNNDDDDDDDIDKLIKIDKCFSFACSSLHFPIQVIVVAVSKKNESLSSSLPKKLLTCHQ